MKKENAAGAFRPFLLLTFALAVGLSTPMAFSQPKKAGSKQGAKQKKTKAKGKKPHIENAAKSEYTLREVMQHLEQGVLQIQSGLLKSNRLMIAKGAERIQDHPSPKGGIKPYIKKNHKQLKHTIKTMDKMVHDNSALLVKEAATSSMIRLQELNNNMVTGCISCHNIFRD